MNTSCCFSSSHSLDPDVLSDASTMNQMKGMKQSKFTVSSAENDIDVVSSKFPEEKKESGHTEAETRDGDLNKTEEEELVQVQTRQCHGRRRAKSLLPNQTYVDHVDTTFDEKTLTSIEVLNLRQYHQSTIGTSLFPVKLQILLKIAEELDFQHIISWLPHGRAFIIHRPLLFEKQIMSKFLAPTKFSSFKRQLNLYDFKRVANGADAGAYYHEMFLRSKPVLAMKMKRRKIKGQIRVSTYVQKEPEFYSMPFLGPLFDNSHCYLSKEHNFDQGSFNMNPNTSVIKRKHFLHSGEQGQSQERRSPRSSMAVKGKVCDKYWNTRRGELQLALSLPNVPSGTLMTYPTRHYNNLFFSEDELRYRQLLHYSVLPLLRPQHYVPTNNKILSSYRLPASISSGSE